MSQGDKRCLDVGSHPRIKLSDSAKPRSAAVGAMRSSLQKVWNQIFSMSPLHVSQPGGDT